MPGLILRVSYTGAKSWSLTYRMQGTAYRLSLGAYPGVSLKLARERAREARGAIQRGENPVATKKEEAHKARTNVFGPVVKEFLAYKASDNLSATYLADIKSLLASLKWDDKLIPSIKHNHIFEVLQARKIVAPGQAKHLRTYLSMFFSYCIQRAIVEENPVKKIADLKIKLKKRKNYFDDAEIVAFWMQSKRISPMFGACLRMLLLTGCRKSEMAELRWDEIHADHILIPEERTKSGRAHMIPLSPLMQAELAAIPRIKDCPWVFTVSGRAPINGFDTAKAKLVSLMNEQIGTPAPWIIHDLRRTVASRFEEFGIREKVIKRVLNHKDEDSVTDASYAHHSFDKEAREALNLWSSHIAALVGPKLVATGDVAA